MRKTRPKKRAEAPRYEHKFISESDSESDEIEVVEITRPARKVSKGAHHQQQLQQRREALEPASPGQPEKILRRVKGGGKRFEVKCEQEVVLM